MTNNDHPTPINSTDGFYAGRRALLLLASLFLVSVFAQVDRILPFILAESIKAELRLSDTQLGLLTGIAFAVCYALLSLPLARLSDRGSPRLVLVACTIVWSAMTGLGGLATGFLFLAATRFGVAVGEAGAVPSAHALIARHIRPERRGTAIGIFSAGIPIGAMVGFGAGGAVADTFGWRVALFGAGALGSIVAILAWFAAGPSQRGNKQARFAPSFLRSSLDLLAKPAFRWLIVGAVATGFAAAPFYAFGTPFLIRQHGLSNTQAGLVFGLLQGLTGIVGTVLGGRGFDRAARAGRGYLRSPALLLIIASATTTVALLISHTSASIALLIPSMLSFTFVIPYAFGTAHLVAGRGMEATASSLALIGTSLLGPALGPLIVGVVSDYVSMSHASNGLGLGLLIVPIASLVTAIVYLVAERRVVIALQASSG